MQNLNGTDPINKVSEPLHTKKQLAISQGSTVLDIVEKLQAPAEALQCAVKLNFPNELIFIQLDNSVVVQTYAQIWERAEKILGGLRALGLQHGHPLILQVDTSPDFAPVLWSCIMGGFVPTPVPLASDDSKSNQSLSKLHKIWQQLGYPTILTTSKLASQIQTGLQLDEPKDITIATIEEIEAHIPDPRLHKLQPHELALLLPSSGTTGKPKLIEINSQTFIVRFLKNAINRKQDAPVKSLLSWFPLESISGILTTTPNGFQKNIYLPLELVISNPLVWLDILNKYRVTHAQTSNFILARVTDQLRINAQGNWDFSSVQKIGIGAEPIVAKTARSFIQLLSPYNLHPNILYPAYGMTECGPIAGSSEGLSLTNTSDADRFVEIGKPTRGHSIRIVDQQGSILEEGQIGRIQVTGPSMTSGYYQAPELTRELFTEDGWINTGDLGFLQDGKLTVTGREKEIIIINARNYSCHEIELVAEEVEGVEPSYTAACAIRQSDSETDELLIFFHSLVSEERQLAQLLKQIRRNIAEKLGINPTYLIPIEKSAIPRTSTGKIQRLQLKQRFESCEFDAIRQQVEVLTNQERESNYVSPRDDLELQLTKIWQEVLDIKSISIRDNLFELGGQSLLAVRLLAQIEKTFQKKLPLAILFQAPTIEQLAGVLSQQGWLNQSEESAIWSPLVPIQAHGSRPPLFCVHALGLSVLYYRDLARHLGKEQPFYALQPQGLNGKQAPLTQIEDMAALYIKEIRSIQSEGPYFLGGSSFGGVVAWEMAQQLHQQGQKVALLALFDTRGSGYLKRVSLRKRVTDHFNSVLTQGLNYILKKVTGKLQWFKNRIQEKGQKIFVRFSQNSLDSLTQTHLVVEKANKQAARNYVMQVYPGRVTVFRAIHQPAPEGWDIDPQMGWSQLAGGGLDIYDVPGNHDSMFREPHVRVLAKKLRACIDRVQTNDLVLGHQAELNSASPLVTIQPNGRKRPFFLVLGGVGGVDGDIGLAVAARLLIHLDSERPFYGLRASILDGELNPYARAEYPPAEVLAADYIKAIRAFQPDGPYLLGGDCLAGIVAFEMAQQLLAQGQEVALLVLLDTNCPTETTYQNGLLPRKLPATIIYHLSQLWHIKPGKRLSYFFDKVMNALKLYLLRDREAWKARFYAHLWQQYSVTLLRYRPQTYPGRIALLVNEALYRQDPTKGWSNVAAGGLEIYKFSGEHTTYIKENSQAIAEQLSFCFDTAEAENLNHET